MPALDTLPCCQISEEGNEVFERGKSSSFTSETSDHDFHDALEEVSDEGCFPVEKSSESESNTDCSANQVDDLGEFKLPNEEIQKKIITRLESYFTDEHLNKDIFLRKRLARNKEGYVTFQFVTSLKKIKVLTRDWRVVLHCLRNSTTLVINEEATKLKRKTPYVQPDDESDSSSNSECNDSKPTDSKTVLAVNLHQGCTSLHTIAALFGKCGNVLSVRVIEPGMELPADLKLRLTSFKHVNTSTCAMVEFSHIAEAKKAVSDLSGDKYDWKSMQVIPLEENVRKPKFQNKSKPIAIPRNTLNKSNRGSFKRQIRVSVSEDSEYGSDSPQTFRRFNNISNNSESSSYGSYSSSGQWMQRRMQQVLSKEVSTSPSQAYSPVTVIRQPRGPDGTRGFAAGVIQRAGRDL